MYFRVFLADTLNFSFWSASDEEKYMVRYGGSDHTGYWSLCAAINRALDVSKLKKKYMLKGLFKIILM